nr:MAG TPA: TFIIB zinc-binding [Caudoviricetes sp.]
MMTAKKALELLNDVEFSEKYQGVQEYTEMLIVCKEALEKQIPKNPIGEGHYCLCPCCRNDLGTWEELFYEDFSMPKHCSNCGCALDWSEVKNERLY